MITLIFIAKDDDNDVEVPFAIVMIQSFFRFFNGFTLIVLSSWNMPDSKYITPISNKLDVEFVAPS